jgi:hypothetical protein
MKIKTPSEPLEGVYFCFIVMYLYPTTLKIKIPLTTATASLPPSIVARYSSWHTVAIVRKVLLLAWRVRFDKLERVTVTLIVTVYLD